MKGTFWRTAVKIIGGIAVLVLMQVPTNVVTAVSLPECTEDSVETPLTIIASAPCAIYGEVMTRIAPDGAPIVIKYMRHSPAGTPKALVVLFAGGDLSTGIEGTVIGAPPTDAGNNFLVRSAQLFAEEGYLVLTLHKPVRRPGGGAETEEFAGNFAADKYCVSPRHAFDIVKAIVQENPDVPGQPDRLNVLLAGTSRGAISIAANYMLSVGILLSSPVASPPPGSPEPTTSCGADSPACPPLFVGHPHPRLQPGFVQVPVHVMAHRHDGCVVSTPSDAEALHHAFRQAGVDSRLDQLNGGFEALADPCQALTHHGYLGIEKKAVKETAKRMDEILRELQLRFRGNRKPVALSGTLPGVSGYTLNLANPVLTSDPDGDQLTYSLPYDTSYRGNPVAMTSPTEVTYFPVARGITDGFVYRVSDGKGGVSVNVVVVTVPP